MPPPARRARCLALAALLATATQPLAAQSPQSARVELRFAAVVGDRDFACGSSYNGIGTTKSVITPTDLRLFVSEVQLIRADNTPVAVALEQDGIWQYKNLALIDFEDGNGPCRNGTKGIRTSVTGSVPAGDYRGLKFTLGVPMALNHGDPTVAPSPLNITAMFWNWQGGYRFLKFDFSSPGLARAAQAQSGHMMHGGGHGAASGFAVHLGSTQCQSPSPTQAPSSCGNPNRAAVAFDRFDVAKDTVVVDVGALLAGTNVDVNTSNTSPGCMSSPDDPDCKDIMQRLGLSYGSAAPGKPVLFRMR